MDPPLRRKRTGGDGSAKPGAEAEPHQLQFWEGQGPVARQEFRPITQILRAGNFAHPNRYASPVMGVLGGRRIWTRSVHPEATPWRFFGDFLAVQKVTRRRSGEISPHPTNPIQNLPPSSVWPNGQPPFPIPSVASRHLPLIRGVGPRGEGFWGRVPVRSLDKGAGRRDREEAAKFPRPVFIMVKTAPKRF